MVRFLKLFENGHQTNLAEQGSVVVLMTAAQEEASKILEMEVDLTIDCPVRADDDGQLFDEQAERWVSLRKVAIECVFPAQTFEPMR